MEATVLVLAAGAVAITASMFLPLVAAAGICAFVPCDPGPKDAAVGYTQAGHVALVVSPCAADKFSRIRIFTTAAPKTLLWGAGRVRPGRAQVIALGTPPPQLTVDAVADVSLPGQVQIEVSYPRGVANSWSYLDGVHRGHFGVFGEGGQSLSAFNRQARAGAVCAWYRRPVAKWWPAIAPCLGVVLGVSAFLRRRRSQASFDAALRRVFADVFP